MFKFSLQKSSLYVCVLMDVLSNHTVVTISQYASASNHHIYTLHLHNVYQLYLPK